MHSVLQIYIRNSPNATFSRPLTGNDDDNKKKDRAVTGCKYPEYWSSEMEWNKPGGLTAEVD